MKRSFNKLFIGALALAAASVGAINVAAQDTAATPDPAAEKTAAYQKFTACYKATDEASMRACIVVGDEYVSKYGTPPDQYSDFVGKKLVTMKDYLAKKPLNDAYKNFSDALTAKNWKGTFDAGRDIMKLQPDASIKLDFALYMARLGYDLAFSTPPDNTYNAEAINYAKTALGMIQNGTVSQAPASNWGAAGAYAHKSKDNAVGWMNFVVGRLTADTSKDATPNIAAYKEGASYFYKAVNASGSEIGKFPLPYQDIGRYYLAELNVKVDEYKTSCKDLTEDTPQCKNIREMQLAFAQRALDAYVRALKVAKDTKASQTLQDSITKTITAVYTARFKKAEGVNEYVNTAPALVDPSSPVTPIPEEVPATTTTGTTTPAAPATTTGSRPATPAPAGTKPAATAAPANSTKPATTPAKPNGAKGAIAKAPAKKKTGR
jgi:hypothetical protein